MKNQEAARILNVSEGMASRGMACRLMLGMVAVLLVLMAVPTRGLAGEACSVKAAAVKSSQKKASGYVLTGKINAHKESVSGKTVRVTSITLDKPIDYTYSYKGTVSATAKEVELETSLSSNYGQWTKYIGHHVSLECESLHGAIHDASMHGVDTLAMGEIRLLRDDG